MEVIEMELTGKQESPTSKDIGRFDVPSDKIRVNGEPYEHFFTVYNRQDAIAFKRVFNEITRKYLGVTIPLVFRRYYQNGVFYDIYQHRWCFKRNGKLIDSYGQDVFEGDSWERCKEEINRRLGKVYHLKD